MKTIPITLNDDGRLTVLPNHASALRKWCEKNGKTLAINEETGEICHFTFPAVPLGEEQAK